MAGQQLNGERSKSERCLSRATPVVDKQERKVLQYLLRYHVTVTFAVNGTSEVGGF